MPHISTNLIQKSTRLGQENTRDGGNQDEIAAMLFASVASFPQHNTIGLATLVSTDRLLVYGKGGRIG